LLLASLTCRLPPGAPRFPYTSSSDLRPRPLRPPRPGVHRRGPAGGCFRVSIARERLIAAAALVFSVLVMATSVEIGRDAIEALLDRKSTRLNSSHVKISYAVFCLKKN